jgi:PKD repeat protein
MNCTFSDASSDPNGADTIEQWRWVFEDGESPDPNPSHQYATAGDHRVELTVTDDQGETGRTDTTFTIQTRPDSTGQTGSLVAKGST